MLVKHAVNGKLYNVVSADHARGVRCLAKPVIKIDPDEHALDIE